MSSGAEFGIDLAYPMAGGLLTRERAGAQNGYQSRSSHLHGSETEGRSWLARAELPLAKGHRDRSEPWRSSVVSKICGSAELFQLIALFRKSGKLTLSRGDTTGIFLFNEGKVFHASNGYSAPSLGEFLVDRHLITHETLEAAVATQRLSDERKKLGAILVEMGAISYETLQGVLRDQLQDIAREFLRWDSGFFNFKTVEGRDEDPEQVFHDDEAKLTEFINVDPFVLDLLAKVDAVGGDGTVRPVPRAVKDSPFEDRSVSSIYDLLNYIVEPGHSVFRSDPADVVTDRPSDLAELRSRWLNSRSGPERRWVRSLS